MEDLKTADEVQAEWNSQLLHGLMAALEDAPARLTRVATYLRDHRSMFHQADELDRIAKNKDGMPLIVLASSVQGIASSFREAVASDEASVTRLLNVVQAMPRSTKAEDELRRASRQEVATLAAGLEEEKTALIDQVVCELDDLVRMWRHAEECKVRWRNRAVEAEARMVSAATRTVATLVKVAWNDAELLAEDFLAKKQKVLDTGAPWPLVGSSRGIAMASKKLKVAHEGLLKGWEFLLLASWLADTAEQLAGVSLIVMNGGQEFETEQQGVDKLLSQVEAILQKAASEVQT